jgi:deoxyribonuclease IV
MGLLGAHTSIAGGLYQAIERGDELQCEAIQIFVQSSRTWVIPPLSEETISRFKATLKNAKFVKRVIAHNSYLLNLTTVDTAARKKSVDYFIRTLERCERLGIDGLVTHPGSHLGAGIDAGIQATIQSINEVLAACPGFNSKVILENTAGQGGCLGHTFEQLEQIANGTSRPEDVYFCFDTQHAFAAGYDLRTSEGYDQTFEEFNRRLNLKNIVAFHLNDSVKEFGCRVDRHEGIGKGFLGKEVFRRLVNDDRFNQIPMCLETDPGGEECKNYRRELKLLRSFRTNS